MQPTATVLVYSDDANTREQVRLAAGPQAGAGRARRWSSWSARRLPAVLKELDQGGIDVCVLDGEAVPGGRHGRVPADQGRDLPLPAGAAADRAARRTPGWPPGAARTRR